MEKQELIRRAVASNTSTLLLASVLKVSEAHAQKLLRQERRMGADVDADGSAGTSGTGQAAFEAAGA
ncbi:hypothetical protein [Streptomyces sp. NPDC003730]